MAIYDLTPEIQPAGFGPQQPVDHGMAGNREWNTEQMQRHNNHNLATQNVIGGIQNHASPFQFMDSINAVNRQLGNRSFLRFVGELHERRQHRVANEIVSQEPPGTGQPLTHPELVSRTHEDAQEIQQADSLQLMPKKKKKGGETASEGALETPSEASARAGPQQVATLPHSEAVEKKSKKSKVQVALNILRKEGTGDFRQYVNQEITVTGSLIALRNRILRAEDLNKNCEAVEAVNERLKVIERREEGEESIVVADIRTEFNAREEKIFKSCISGNIRLFREQIKIRGIDFNMATKAGTPLCYAASNGRVGIVRELLSIPGVAVNLAEKTGATPLSFAVLHRHVEVVKLLLEVAGINVNPKALFEMTPLHMAIQNGDEEIIRHLLAAPKINIDVRDDEGVTPLLLAFQRNFPGILKLLIAGRANVNLMYGCFTPLLCIAVHKGDIETIRILLTAPDIQIDLSTTDGRTALYLATKLGFKEIVELLLKNGSDPNITGDEGIAPLHLACSCRDIETVSMLLNAGADLNAVTSAEKYTPHDIANLRGAYEILALLEAGGKAMPAAVETAQPADATQVVKENKGQIDPEPADSATGTLSLSGTQPSAKETPTPLSIAKSELTLEILRKLGHDSLEPLEGIRMMADIRVVDSMESLCEKYNRLAGIERQRERAKRRSIWHRLTTARIDATPRSVETSFALGKSLNLDACAVEKEIKQYLEQSQHRFVSQAVNDMVFGRGKSVSHYPGMLHASAGITGVGSCTVFYYTNSDRQEIRIVGIGHHLDRETYRLNYKVDEMSDCGGVLRLAW